MSSTISSASTFEVDNPTPVITAIAASGNIVGGAPGIITVSGSGFAGNAMVLVSGTARVTTFVNAVQLTAALTAADITQASILPVAVSNPAPGGGVSSSSALTVINPVPVLTSLTPPSLGSGSTTATTVTATGSSFVQGATVSVGGAERAAAVASATSLSFHVTPAEQLTAGTLNVVITNPSPGGGSSTASTLTITNPTPGDFTLSPSSSTVNPSLASTPATIALTGTNLVPASVVNINGAARATTYLSATNATFIATAADIGTAGTLSVTITNPSPGGGSSPTTHFTVNNPIPSISSFSPATAVTGNATPVTVTVTGANSFQVLQYK